MHMYIILPPFWIEGPLSLLLVSQKPSVLHARACNATQLLTVDNLGNIRVCVCVCVCCVSVRIPMQEETIGSLKEKKDIGIVYVVR